MATNNSPVRDLSGMEYYKEVDRSKLRPFQGVGIHELRRLAENEQDPQRSYIYDTIFTKTGATEDLEQAIKQSASIDENTADYISRLRDLIVMLTRKYKRTHSLEDLNIAIFRAQEMVVASPEEHPDRPNRIGDWINLMLTKFRDTQSRNDLDDAVFSAQQVGASVNIGQSNTGGLTVEVSIPRAGSENRRTPPAPTLDIDFAAAAAAAAAARNRSTGNRNPFTVEAVLSALRAGAMMSTGGAGRLGSPNLSRLNLGDSNLADSSAANSGNANLADILGLLGGADLGGLGLDSMDRGDMDWASILGATRLHLQGVRYGQDYENTGNVASLHRSVEYNERALAAAPTNHPDRATFLNNLGYTLQRRFELIADLTDLNRSVDLARQCIEITPLSHPDRGLWLRNYGYGLGTQFMQTGDLEKLNLAIKYCEDAVAAGDPNNPEVADWMSSLGVWLWRRSELMGLMEDFNQAIELCERAVSMPCLNDHDMAGRIGNLIGCLDARYERSGARSDLDRGIELTEEALKLSRVNQTHRSGLLIQLSNFLSRRFALTESVGDISCSIDASNEAIAIIPKQHSFRATWMINQGVNYGTRFKATGNLADLSKSIEFSSDGVAEMPHGHKDRGRALNILGNRLLEKYSITKSNYDLEEALLRYMEGWSSPGVEPSRRIKIAQNIANIFAIQTRWKESSNILEEAVKLIPMVSPRALKHTDKQVMLSEFAGLASLAAATAIHAGKTGEQALQILELGRGVIAGLLMELRGDISELEKEHPDLAKSFIALRDELDGPSGGGSNHLMAHGKAPSLASRTRGRLEADQEFSKLLTNIRAQPGFQNFLLPPTVEEMKAAADPDPIIVINTTRLRCDAIIVERDNIRILNLPDLALETAEKKAQHLQTSRLSTEFEFEPLLEWLWDVICHPCLNALGFEEAVLDDDWQRVWWIPTGVISQFPLHAAGYHQEDSEDAVVERVMSSYASSIKALVNGRRRHIPSSLPQSNHAVLIAMEETKGLPMDGSLPFAKEEMEMLKELCPSLQLTPITSVCRKADVLKHLETCKIFHFAGHGLSDPMEPSRSCLLLEDWQTDPLTVGDLRDHKLQENPPFLGYLSACSTGANEAAKLADEGIHLISAFQLAGFRHVVGTLWEVSDSACVDIARTLYGTIRDEGMTDRAVCRGLHMSVRAVRSGNIAAEHSTRNAKVVSAGPVVQELDFDWVPYVHFGV
ncbi:hypothetical protein DRE_04217 [Drechslerella stenobrocha 248]|uniref:CHAT domain-containing protein n=1 Tax=Drechslerella stenobrocha 248 TaxID=1043628 RepID=W7HT57_9PEZI|nr:hypothetical protein DRE_04217 [Drechslerella stenobrocha 248]